MATRTALKDYIDRAAVRRLGTLMRAVDSRFALERFVEAASAELAPLEFTARTRHVAAALRAALPRDEHAALAIVGAALPPPLARAEGMFAENFWLWPVSDLVGAIGPAAWAECLQVCYRLTQCFTAEFAIRPLLQARPAETLACLLEWTADPSEHVRRLCSEGSRPQLPWASRLELPRAGVVPILEALRQDPSPYVQKSVANHLHDLGKADPDWLLATMQAWHGDAAPATGAIVRHALRSLVKRGDPAALAVLGYARAELGAVSLRLAAPRLAIGATLEASLSVSSAARVQQPLLIDWVMHYARPGAAPYRKVFKGKVIELAPAQVMAYNKSFAMRERVTRKLHPGQHRLEVQINGALAAGADFQLRA